MLWYFNVANMHIIIVHINEKMTHYHTVNLHIKNVFQIGKYNTDSKKSLVLLHT